MFPSVAVSTISICLWELPRRHAGRSSGYGIYRIRRQQSVLFWCEQPRVQRFETLTGGSANDTFAFAGTYTFTGSLNGGAGTDSFDYSAYDTAITLNLQTGIISGLIGSFSGMEGIFGSLQHWIRLPE
jgi:hypothetical protein